MAVIVVHTFGKVGSTAVHRTLKEAGYEAIHVHSLMEPKLLQDVKAKERVDYLRSKKKPLKVIVLIRKPARRNLSAFFNSRAAGILDSPHFEDFPHEIPLVFFDNEIKAYWGIDVYREPFDKQRGWQIYDDKMLVIRQEDLMRVWKDAFNEFTGNRAPTLHQLNVTTLKNAEYPNFCKTVDPEYVARLHDSKYYRHFYA